MSTPSSASPNPWSLSLAFKDSKFLGLLAEHLQGRY